MSGVLSASVTRHTHGKIVLVGRLFGEQPTPGSASRAAAEQEAGEEHEAATE